MPEPSDLLLILKAGHHAANQPGSYRVTQQVSPRVVIVEPLGDTTKQSIEELDAVDVVVERGVGVAGEITEKLTKSEALFVTAYSKRGPEKRRPGDGFHWDAEGFMPPDLPEPKRQSEENI